MIERYPIQIIVHNEQAHQTLDLAKKKVPGNPNAIISFRSVCR